MNWRTRCTKYSPTCPLVFTSGMTYRTVLTTGRDENTSCPVGTEYTNRVLTNGAFECGGIDGKLGGLTPMNSYARLVCIRDIKITVLKSLAVTRQRVIVASY